RAVPGRLLGDDARVAGERGTRWSRPCLDADRTGDLECSAAGNADVARAVEVSGIPDDARTRGTAEIAAVVSQSGGIGQIVHVPYGDVAVGPDARSILGQTCRRIAVVHHQLGFGATGGDRGHLDPHYRDAVRIPELHLVREHASAGIDEAQVTTTGLRFSVVDAARVEQHQHREVDLGCEPRVVQTERSPELPVRVEPAGRAVAGR